MVVGYVRVSTKHQSYDRQVDALIESGVDERNIYKEKMSGTKSDRPELKRMIDGLKPGDVCVVAELTRVSRSTKDLFNIVEQVQAKGADIKSLAESWLDTSTPQGKLMFTIFAGLSQFERDLTVARIEEGLAAAKARGRVGGRPSKQKEKGEVVVLLYEKGVTIADIAKQTNLSRSTVERVVRSHKAGNVF